MHDFPKEQCIGSYKNSPLPPLNHHPRPIRGVWWHLTLHRHRPPFVPSHFFTILHSWRFTNPKISVLNILRMRLNNQLSFWCIYKRQLTNPTCSTLKWVCTTVVADFGTTSLGSWRVKTFIHRQIALSVDTLHCFIRSCNVAHSLCLSFSTARSLKADLEQIHVK